MVQVCNIEQKLKFPLAYVQSNRDHHPTVNCQFIAKYLQIKMDSASVPKLKSCHDPNLICNGSYLIYEFESVCVQC